YGPAAVRAGRSTANAAMSTSVPPCRARSARTRPSRGRLEAVGGAQGDQDALVAGQGAEDEVAVQGQGVETGRGVVVDAGGGQVGAQEPGQALGGGRVGSKPRVVAVTW